jgi:hypothetical protein
VFHFYSHKTYIGKQAAYSGSQDEVQRLVNEFNLDVNAPRNSKNSKNTRKQEENSQYETLLHAAACKCDETLFTFLIERGKVEILDPASLLIASSG